MTTLDKIMPWYNGWHYPPMYVYILAADGHDRASLTAEVDRAVTKTHPSYVRDDERDYVVQPITEIHLHSNLVNEWQANSNFIYVQILTVVASLILFLHQLCQPCDCERN
jgi:putative ABC transport system permease protein